MSSANADPLLWNKIIGSVLMAGLIAMLSGFIADLLVEPEHLAENVFKVAVPEAETGSRTAAEEVVGPEPITALLAAADIGAGQQLSKKCGACHTFDDGGPNKVGPNLWNVIGREVASVAGFKYSSALSGIDGIWGYEELNRFIYKPKRFAPGNKMSFPGLRKTDDRANLIAWLRSLSASPPPLPN
ncbi:MAG: c-type cytochrome [Kiloniellales bacterium]